MRTSPPPDREGRFPDAAARCEIFRARHGVVSMAGGVLPRRGSCLVAQVWRAGLSGLSAERPRSRTVLPPIRACVDGCVGWHATGRRRRTLCRHKCIIGAPVRRLILPLLLIAFTLPVAGCVVEGPGYHCGGWWHHCR